MRGFKNFKGSDASGPSLYSYSMSQPFVITCLQIAYSLQRVKLKFAKTVL